MVCFIKADPEFVNFLRSPGIDPQPGGFGSGKMDDDKYGCK
jgi:hypothetical protein